MFVLKLTNMSNFQSLEVVVRISEAQLQTGDYNCIMQRLIGQLSFLEMVQSGCSKNYINVMYLY